MKKLVIQINRQRFELESSSRENDQFILETAQELERKIEMLRREGGFPDSARATLLAALLVALETKNLYNISNKGDVPVPVEQIKSLNEQIDNTLARTDGSPAKALAQ